MTRRLATESLRQQLDEYWLAIGDAAPLVLVRRAFGILALGWVITLLPDLRLIFFDDGLAHERRYPSGTIVTIFRWFDHDVAFVTAAVLLVTTALLVVTNSFPRFTVPATSILLVSFIDASQPWGIGAELVMVLAATYLGVFHALTPSELLGERRDAFGSYGRTPLWGIRLMQLQLAIGYVMVGASKLNGNDWRDGSAVFHALEAEQLQRFEPPGFLTDHVAIVATMTYLVLGTELLLGPALLARRTRQWAVLVAIAMHVSFEIFLELGFFALAMIVFILTFVSASNARRVLAWTSIRSRPHLRPRPAAIAST